MIEKLLFSFYVFNTHGFMCNPPLSLIFSICLYYSISIIINISFFTAHWRHSQRKWFVLWATLRIHSENPGMPSSFLFPFKEEQRIWKTRWKVGKAFHFFYFYSSTSFLVFFFADLYQFRNGRRRVHAELWWCKEKISISYNRFYFIKFPFLLWLACVWWLVSEHETHWKGNR